MKPFSSSIWLKSLRGLALLGALSLPVSGVHADTVRTPRSAIGQVAGKLILRFDDSVSTQERNRILAQVGGVVQHTYSTGWMSVQVPQAKTAAALKALGANAKIAGVEPNYRWRGPKVTPSDNSQLPALRQSQAMGSGPVPNDPLYPSQWALQKIGAPQAWKTTTGSNDVIIGIMDSGVKADYPDLKENIWTNPREIPNNGIDDDHDGYIRHNRE